MGEPYRDAVDLESAGWQQGDLLPALSWSVNYLPSSPVTDLSQADGGTDLTVSGADVPGHSVATGLLPEDRFLVLASQTCDVLKPIEADPTVLALGAFICDDDEILSQASSNSVRYFLLDPDKKVVVDATIQAVIEKPLLATLDRRGGPPTEDVRIQFGRWFGRRFSRPALPDDVQKYVVAPIGRAVRRARGKDNSLGRALRHVLDVRFLRLAGRPPYEVKLLFIVDRQHQADVAVPLGEFVARLRERMSPSGTASLSGADIVDLYEISAGQLSDTDRVYLEDVSYRGGQITGEIPDADDDDSWL